MLGWTVPDSASFGTNQACGSPEIGGDTSEEPRLVLWSSRAGDTHRVFDSLQDLCLTIAVAHFTKGGDVRRRIKRQWPS